VAEPTLVGLRGALGNILRASSASLPPAFGPAALRRTEARTPAATRATTWAAAIFPALAASITAPRGRWPIAALSTTRAAWRMAVPTARRRPIAALPAIPAALRRTTIPAAGRRIAAAVSSDIPAANDDRRGRIGRSVIWRPRAIGGRTRRVVATAKQCDRATCHRETHQPSNRKHHDICPSGPGRSRPRATRPSLSTGAFPCCFRDVRMVSRSGAGKPAITFRRAIELPRVADCFRLKSVSRLPRLRQKAAP
jgi:hypothetical protein